MKITYLRIIAYLFVFAFFSELMMSCSEHEVFCLRREQNNTENDEPLFDVPISIGFLESKALSVNTEDKKLTFMYKAIPLVGIEERMYVPGYRSEYSCIKDGIIKLCSGMWNIVVSLQDDKGNCVYEGEEIFSITENSAKNGLFLTLRAVEDYGYGTLKIELDTSYSDLHLLCKNVRNGEETEFDFQYVFGESQSFDMPAGTYIATLSKNYKEVDGALYSVEKNMAVTVLVKIENDTVIEICGSIEDFRKKGTVYLTLPTVANAFPYEAYDYFTYEELKSFAYCGNIFISAYLDGKKMEDALYFVPEGENGETLEKLGKAEGVHLYAHRKKYLLQWLIAENNGENIGTTSFSPDGLYYWNERIVSPVVEKTGYDFTGWNPLFTGKMPDENVSYKPVWTPETHILTLDYNVPSLSPLYENSDMEKINRQPKSLSVTYSMPYEGLPVPVLTEYVFSGWQLQNSTKDMITPSSIVKCTDNSICKALWNKKCCVVSFNLNRPSDAIGTEPGVITDKKVYYGDSITFPFTEYNFDNYAFDGWYTEKTGGTKVQNGCVLTPSEVGERYLLYAHWIPICTVNVGTGFEYLGSDKDFYCSEIKITDNTNSNKVHSVQNPTKSFKVRLQKNVKFSVEAVFKSQEGGIVTELIQSGIVLDSDKTYLLDPLKPDEITWDSSDSVQDLDDARCLKIKENNSSVKYKKYDSFKHSVVVNDNSIMNNDTFIGGSYLESRIESYGCIYLLKIGTYVVDITFNYSFLYNGFEYAISYNIKPNVTLIRLDAPYVTVQRMYTKAAGDNPLWIRGFYKTTYNDTDVYITMRCRNNYNDFTNKCYNNLSANVEYCTGDYKQGLPGHYYFAYITGCQTKKGYARSYTAYYVNSVGLNSRSTWYPEPKVWSDSPYSDTELYYDLDKNFVQKY